jgi:hypothetical protein
MRLAAYLVMMLVVVISVIEGDIALALGLAGLKALLVGVGYMELRHAARPHMLGFAMGMAALTGVLVIIAAD